MKPTVSQQTAKQLAEAGFLPPEVAVGQVYFDNMGESYIVGNRTNNVNYPSFGVLVFRSFSSTLWEYESEFSPFFAPTALDILAQFPGSLSRGIDGQWHCRFTIIQYDEDCYYDECPHEAAAKAFLAWKAGLE